MVRVDASSMPTDGYTSKLASKPLLVLVLLLAGLTAAAAGPASGAAAAEPPLGEPPQLAFDSGSYGFGLQPVNSSPGQANVQLQNVGREPVQVNSLGVAGPDHEAFWTNGNCNSVYLQPNETCSLQVYFAPHEARDYAAELRADAGPYSFAANLTGTGGRAIFEPEFNPTDFGVAAVGSAGNTREIRLSNVGNMAGGAFIAVISGGAVGSFQLLDENCTGHQLAPAATCTLQVHFRPLSEGVKTATLGLFGEQEGGTLIGLTGVGTAPLVDPPPPPAFGSPPAAATAPAVLSKRNPPKYRPRIRRRHRRADLDVSRLVTPAG
jgi:hypothetical protein